MMASHGQHHVMAPALPAADRARSSGALSVRSGALKPTDPPVRRTHTLIVDTSNSREPPERFVVDVRYNSLVYIARGAYGMVCVAEDTVAKRRVAIKKITNVFRNLGDAKRVLREMKLLRYFTSQTPDCNIVKIYDVMVSPSHRDFEDLYIVTNLMETNLRNVIVSGQPLEDTHYKYFLYQILRALKFVHSANIIHRDLKPANLLVNASCELQVCDFGLARPIKNDMTPYVQTRWYRAPELLVNSASYDGRVDVWSVGCIFAELLLRRPLFPGDSPKTQLQRIVKFLGTPSADEMSFITSGTAVATVHSVGFRAPKVMAEMFPAASPEALDLLSRMLTFDPRRRITVEEAISHPYLREYHEWEGVVEPLWQHSPIRFEFDDMKLNRHQLQAYIVAELNNHYAPSPPPPGSAMGVAVASLRDGTAASRSIAGAGGGAAGAGAVVEEGKDGAPSVARAQSFASGGHPGVGGAGRGGGGSDGIGPDAVSAAGAGIGAGDDSSVHAPVFTFSNATTDGGEAVVQVGMFARTKHGLVASGALSSTGYRPQALTHASLTMTDSPGEPSPAAELSLSARMEAAQLAAAEAARAEARRQRQAHALARMGSGGVLGRASSASSPAAMPSTPLSPPTLAKRHSIDMPGGGAVGGGHDGAGPSAAAMTSGPVPSASDSASLSASTSSNHSSAGPGGVDGSSQGHGAATSALPQGTEAALQAMQQALQLQMSSQIDMLMGRIGEMMAPTQQRLGRLEEAVGKLASAVGGSAARPGSPASTAAESAASHSSNVDGRS